jgi:hypothetical protein
MTSYRSKLQKKYGEGKKLKQPSSLTTSPVRPVRKEGGSGIGKSCSTLASSPPPLKKVASNQDFTHNFAKPFQTRKGSAEIIV